MINFLDWPLACADTPDGARGLRRCFSLVVSSCHRCPLSCGPKAAQTEFTCVAGKAARGQAVEP